MFSSLNFVLKILPFLFSSLTLVIGFYLYYFSINKNEVLSFEEKEKKYCQLFKTLIVINFVFKILYAKTLSIVQYFIWNSSKYTQVFIKEGIGHTVQNPINNFPWLFQKTGGYFLYYILSRFWISIFITLAFALIFYLILFFLHKINSRLLTKSDILLGFLGSLTSGWPGFVAYFFIFMLSFLLIGLKDKILIKEKYTTITYSLWISALIVAIFGYWILNNIKAIQILSLGI